MDMLSFLRSRDIGVYLPEDGARDKHISRTGEWAQMKCPICGGDHLWLGYNLERDYFNCYNHGSASKYDLFRAWFPSENARDLLKGLDSLDVTITIKEKPTGAYLPPLPHRPLAFSLSHFAYLKGRGFDPVTCEEKWGIKALWGDVEPRHRNRLFIPVYDEAGRPGSWQTRAIHDDGTPRYLTAPKNREAVPIKHLLYGEQFVNKFSTIIVTEGVFDAIAVGTNAVATFGKKITNEQFMKISQYKRRIICFDGERDTKAQARELARSLSEFSGLTGCFYLDAPDPATAPKEEIDRLLGYAGLL